MYRFPKLLCIRRILYSFDLLTFVPENCMEINILKKLGEAGRRGEGGTIVYQKKLYILKNSLLKLSKFWKFLQCAEAHSGPVKYLNATFYEKVNG